MKKISLLILVLMLIMGPVFASAQTTSPQAIDPGILSSIRAQIQDIAAKIAALRNSVARAITLIEPLRQGSRGDDVKVLQALLAADASIYPEGAVTGFFGPLTTRAVDRFQRKHALGQGGSLDAMTLAKLRAMLSDTPLAFEGPEKKLCTRIPPGHLIAPGWLKKMGTTTSIIPHCMTLPPGIEKKLDILPPATTTPPVATTTPPFDTTAPVIYGLAASTTASTSVITWTTSEPATAKIYYGTTSPIVVASALLSTDAISGISHSHILPGLTASTTYYLIVEARDTAGNTATSSPQSFMTMP